MKKIIFTTAVLLLLFTSCKKDKSTASGTCNKTVADIAGTYAILKIEVGMNGVFLDITSQQDACEKDDRLTLNANGTSAYQDLGTVCSPSGDDSGTWSIDANGRMTIKDNGGNDDISSADITSFDCHTLVLTGTDISSPAEQVRLTLKK
ncbi:hypothetical protein BH11BAC5_BH11BAC5_54760 [soil metagenome]